MFKSRITLTSLTLLLTGVMLSQLWFWYYNPKKPLYVEIVNDTKSIIPSVVIEHGTPNLQEKVMLVRIKPNEQRVITLNHKPGLGFSIQANFANGDKTEICGGKTKGYWFYRETITKFGIYTTPIR